MKDRTAACIFCRHASSPLRLTPTIRRWKSSVEPFVLPRVVIDLDAADNPHVQSFDDFSKAKQNRELLSYDRKKSLRSIAPRHPKFDDAIKRSGWHRFDLARNVKTPPDILTYALLGGGNRASTDHRRGAGTSPKLGIGAQDIALRNVREVASDFVTDNDERLRRAGFDLDSESARRLTESIRRCYSLDSLEEILGILSVTKEGCKLLADNGDAIAASILLCRRRLIQAPGSAPASRILRILNNLHLSMTAKGIKPSRILCDRGIHYAAKTLSLSALHMYLKVATLNGHMPHARSKGAPVELLRAYTRQKFHETTSAHQVELVRKRFLTVLTGWEDADGPSQAKGGKRTVSLGHYLTRLRKRAVSEDQVYKYIFTLGQLKLTQLLVSEWRDLLSRENPVYGHNQAYDGYQTIGRAHVFALAFSAAGDPEKALAVLKTLSALSDTTYLKLSQGEIFNPRSKLLAPHAARLRHMIYAHYWILNLSATGDFWEQVEVDFVNIPKDPEPALRVLERYLLLDYGVGNQARSVVIYNLEGKEALVVKSLDEGPSLFAKPLEPIGQALFTKDAAGERIEAETDVNSESKRQDLEMVEQSQRQLFRSEGYESFQEERQISANVQQ